ncbi:MAG: hypothetical protein A2826_00905 [Candidatus Doudnabacteria bacterium RIFCSPHIGHO2_01_FULL_43_23]|uniref:Uncharacterized protein n=1 Tax=Candidatus Doudnabacteria bacterium RIFCSPHIGHO2_01_FULL_43_23 TaxID=1817822 RepID=A0A1F5NR22_9BACT|nr:MAG: hypothetical protein A2826_00905 [Candidatus Doudnabacteria bacterium RIFCSPHIGHO2_01_FULL_43_23]
MNLTEELFRLLMEAPGFVPVDTAARVLLPGLTLAHARILIEGALEKLEGDSLARGLGHKDNPKWVCFPEVYQRLTRQLTNSEIFFSSIRILWAKALTERLIANREIEVARLAH